MPGSKPEVYHGICAEPAEVCERMRWNASICDQFPQISGICVVNASNENAHTFHRETTLEFRARRFLNELTHVTRIPLGDWMNNYSNKRPPATKPVKWHTVISMNAYYQYLDGAFHSVWNVILLISKCERECGELVWFGLKYKLGLIEQSKYHT